MIAVWGVQTSWNRPPKGPVATHQGAWHQRIDDNPLTAQIPGFSHRKIRLGPTFHTVSGGLVMVLGGDSDLHRESKIPAGSPPAAPVETGWPAGLRSLLRFLRRSCIPESSVGLTRGGGVGSRFASWRKVLATALRPSRSPQNIIFMNGTLRNRHWSRTRVRA